MTENPYEILGISPDATPEEVKRAYRKKARENHPDLNPGDKGAEARMNKINEAYDRITNPEKYAASDARRRANTGGAAGYGNAGSSSAGGYSGYSNTGAGSTGAGGTGGGYYNPYGQPGRGSGQGGQNTQNPYGWTTVNFDDLFGGGFGTAGGQIHPEPSATDTPEVRQAINFINSKNYKSAIDLMQKIPSSGRNARWYYLFALANNGAGNTVAAHDNIAKARRLDPQNPDYMRAENSFKQRAQTYRTTGEGRGFTSFGFDPNWLCCCICLGPTCLSYANRLCLMPGMWG
jgi:molecular chaperone DnaJ